MPYCCSHTLTTSKNDFSLVIWTFAFSTCFCLSLGTVSWLCVVRGGPTLWGGGSLATPTKKKIPPNALWKKKKKKSTWTGPCKIIVQTPPKNFPPKIIPLKMFLLKNSHDYVSRPAIKSKNFREIKRFQINVENKRLKKVNSFTKLHTLCH